MATYRPAQIFASISTKPEPKKIVKSQPEQWEETSQKVNKHNEIRVSATGEMSLTPDRCKFTVCVNSKKETAQDAKNSVTRRLDYILQTLNNHQVKESDITTSKVLQRIDGLYDYQAEVTTHLPDFKKCQSISNFLVEKLDESVKVCPPEFYQSPQRLENLRRQTSLLAARNAKQKAAELGKFLHCTVGKVISFKEDSFNEWEGPIESTYDPDVPVTMQHRIAMATVHVNIKVSVTFDLKVKAKSKEAMKT